MRLQKATRCALYAVLELASDPKRQLSANEIAEKYDISTNHLAKVLRSLGREGLVEAVRGAGGGYRFSGNAKRTTLLDVIRLFETVETVSSGEREPGDDTPEGLALTQVIEEVEAIERATFHSITLDTMMKLVGRHRK
ncbi:putative HTH-type transcriptional regulator BadM [Rhodospirillaceae bacterium LM-1]|nr:putative HTH-type transcriptional regulator BadM [Rhodospirillaceae bacterium LM-1]